MSDLNLTELATLYAAALDARGIKKINLMHNVADLIFQSRDGSAVRKIIGYFKNARQIPLTDVDKAVAAYVQIRRARATQTTVQPLPVSRSDIVKTVVDTSRVVRQASQPRTLIKSQPSRLAPISKRPISKPDLAKIVKRISETAPERPKALDVEISYAASTNEDYRQHIYNLGAVFRNTNGPKKEAAFFTLINSVSAGLDNYMPSAESCYQYVKWAAHDILAAAGIDQLLFPNIMAEISEENKMVDANAMINMFRGNLLSIAANYVNFASKNKNLVFTTRPLQIAKSEVKEEIYMMFGSTDPDRPVETIPDHELLVVLRQVTGVNVGNTYKLKFMPMPRLYGTVDSTVIAKEIMLNPAFAKSNGPMGTMAHRNGNQLLFRADQNSLQKNIVGNKGNIDSYYGAIAGSAVMSTFNGINSLKYKYDGHECHCDMIFGIGTIEQYKKDPAPRDWENLNDIVMRSSEEHAQFYHEFLDYTYCDKVGSAYYGKYIPAEHPCLEFMESPKYVPNACVLSAFISVLGTYVNKRGMDPYETLIEAAGIVAVDKKNHRPAKEYMKKVRASINPEIPINFAQLNKICTDLRVFARVYTTDGKFLQGCGISDAKLQATHYRSSYNFIYSNGHLYYCSADRVNTISAKWGTKRQPTLIPHMPDGIYHCNPMKARVIDASQVTEYLDIEHAMSFVGKWRGTGIFKTDVDLLDVFREIRKAGLMVIPKFHGDSIIAIFGKHVINGEQVKFSFIPNVSERGVHISDPNEYVRYVSLSTELYNLIITHRNRSDYTPQTKPIFKCFASPYSGRFHSLDDDYGSKKRKSTLPPVEHNHIDCSKHYTTEAMNIPAFSVFGVFDEPKMYPNPVDARQLEMIPAALYFVSVPADAFDYLGNSKMLGLDFTQPDRMLHGYNIERLIRLARKPIMILGEFVPHRVTKNPLPDFFADETFDAPLKRAANEIWGRLGTHEQMEENTLLYTNPEEAAATLNAIRQVTCQTASGVRCKVTPFNICENAIAIHVATERVECVNGFLPIKKAIYDGSRIKAMEMCAMMIGYSILPTAVNTDAVYYTGDASTLIADLEHEGLIGANPGQYNLSKTPTNIRRFDIISGITRFVPGPMRSFRPRETIYDKWDNISDKLILLHGKFPGVGKSYVSMSLAKKLCVDVDGNKIGHAIFVSPYNEHLLENFATYLPFGECRTTASFFGMYITPSGQLACHDEAKDIIIPEDTKAVIFDEIYLNNIATLTQIYKFVLAHPDITIIANGDYKGQMRSVEQYTDKDAIEKAVNIIFEGSTEIILTVIQRNKCAKYEEFIVRLRETVSMQSTDRHNALMQLIVDFNINTVSDPHAIPLFDRAIAWRNETKLALNQCKTNYVIPGAKIRCHTMFRISAHGAEERDTKTDNMIRPKIKIDCRRGDAFQVVRVLKDVIELTPIDGTEQKIKSSIIALHSKYLANFGVHFAKTAHGYQGATIKGKVLICDIFTDHVLKPEAYNYVALTRNTDLSDIYIYIGPANFNLKTSKYTNGEIVKHKQICTQCLRVMRGGEACLEEKSTVCVYCERIDKAQTENTPPAVNNIEHTL